MKPQKKAIVAQKALKSPSVTKKRKVNLENSTIDSKKDKKPPRKVERIEDTRRKLEILEKRKLERKKKLEEKKKSEELKKKEKIEKVDDKKKSGIKDMEKKNENMDENKKVDKINDKIEESLSDINGVERKKNIKSDDKLKIEKQLAENKKKYEKTDDKKKPGKEGIENLPTSNLSEDDESKLIEEKVDLQNSMKKKNVKEDKKKETKTMKPDSKESTKNSPAKEKKMDSKNLVKDLSKKAKSLIVKKDLKQVNKKSTKKTVVVKKSHAPLAKKLFEKKLKLVKAPKEDNATTTEDEESSSKSKKKNSLLANKLSQDKKPKLAKQMKAKLPPKNGKISTALKKEKLKKITEKIVNKKKAEQRDSEKVISDGKKVVPKEEPLNTDEIKREIVNEKDDNENIQQKSSDNRKSAKNAPKPRALKKGVRKPTKASKSQDGDGEKGAAGSEDQSKTDDNVKSSLNTKKDAENPVKINLKEEENEESSNAPASSSNSGSENSDEEQNTRKTRQKKNTKKKGNQDESGDEERARRMRLFGFWTGPKRHRVASLNALAKVHCLYENEAGGVYLGGFCKPKPENKDKQSKKTSKEDKEESTAVRKEKDKKPDVGSKTESENTSKRNLRNVPGLRGKHWDMMECSSSSSSSEEDDSSERNERNVKRGRKKNTTRRKKNEEVMDLKDMVVCKRMASLNASAMLAASYSDEKNRQTSSEDESSESSEVEVIKRRKGDTRAKQVAEEDALKPAKKVVIVNQDTDVTITGVYVNQTRSTHHEGFCSIAGMQYRISSTSHTQTAATAVPAELHEQKVEQPCKSYTPLGALSSMQPPGSQGNHPNMSPRRHSAFTAPHQHGYYQPAGPLIQHPPTLPPVKGPPPEPTPTPPQNSEGSDDLVATSTTSGGTNSTGNSWRSYRKTESRVASSAIPSTSIVPTGGGFYRAYCPQYYGTPPQYQELCYPPTYPHPHPHPPPYYKYASPYRRQYYGYPDAPGGAGAPVAGNPGGPGVVEYQPPPPPPPGEYPMPPYYAGYPPPPPPPPPLPNPAYLHTQGRPIVDHTAFQSCPCPMQSCPKNVDTGPLIGNGKGAPVASGPGLSLPPSALVGPPSPARGLAGLAPPHGANAWDTDRVQLNNHRSLNQSQQLPSSASHNLQNECHNDEKMNNKICNDDKIEKCACQERACTSTCEVKQETLSPSEITTPTPESQQNENLQDYKVGNNNVKCESCSVAVNDNLTCAANCNVKCEDNDYKCEIIKCEQCMKEGQIGILEIDKDSGILLIDDKLEGESGVKEEIDDVALVDGQNWEKPDYEHTVTEETEEKRSIIVEEFPKCQKLTKRKLSLDSLSSNGQKKRKVDKRTLSVDSTWDIEEERVLNPMNGSCQTSSDDGFSESPLFKKKQFKKECPKRKAEDTSICELNAKKPKIIKQIPTNPLKNPASETSIMETINNVIQQSLQMTKKKDSKLKIKENKNDKKRTVNLLSMIKKVPKTIVKAVIPEKLCLPPKTESKCVKELKVNKIEVKSKLNKIPEIKCKNKTKSSIIVNDIKAKVLETKMREISKNIDNISKTKALEDKCEDIRRAALAKKKNNNKSTKKTGGKKSNGKTEENIVVSENCSLVKRPFLKPKWSNGWSWEGESVEAKVYLTNEDSAFRRCYKSMRHTSGDVLRPRDCVLLKSGQRKADLPFVAKIAALWENPDDGEMMFSLLWYYRPEHTEQGRTEYDTEDEVFASRHRDANSVACIEDKCYILTFNEYCRYRKNLRRMEEGLECPGLIVPPGELVYPRESRQPPIPVPSDMVLFCRRVYDYRGKKLVKNPG